MEVMGTVMLSVPTMAAAVPGDQWFVPAATTTRPYGTVVLVSETSRKFWLVRLCWHLLGNQMAAQRNTYSAMCCIPRTCQGAPVAILRIKHQNEDGQNEAELLYIERECQLEDHHGNSDLAFTIAGKVRWGCSHWPPSKIGQA